MKDDGQDTRALLLMVLLALWAAAFGYSVYFFLTAAPTGDGFTRGLNRISGFLGWQGIAGMFAIACFGIGRSVPRTSGIRRVSVVPLALVLVLILGVFAIIGWSYMSA